jgi:23S rRNA pseudouridine2605 synthase
VRLNKLLADCGIASRRRADELITGGRVWIDGEMCTELGRRVDPDEHKVEVDGVVLKRGGAPKRYYLLNKPSGVICTNERREARTRAIDLITDRDKGRIYTVGRLDEDTEGLILLTSDGDFAHHIMHPRFEVPKTYLVKLKGRIADEDLQKVREGVYLADGKTGGARVLVRRRSPVDSILWVTISEGKNREVRRVFARLGHAVVQLRRIRIGSLTDRGLKTGRWRVLTRGEVREMLELADSGEATLRPPGPGGSSRPSKSQSCGRAGSRAQHGRRATGARPRGRAGRRP